MIDIQNVSKSYKKKHIFDSLDMQFQNHKITILLGENGAGKSTLLRLIDISGFSFPSGHAMGSTSFFGSAIYVINRHDSGISKGVLIGLCALFILLISTSRVYLGVHYPTDIIAGIIGGVFCIVLSTLILKKQLAV